MFWLAREDLTDEYIQLMIFKTWRIKHIRRFCTAVSAGQGLRAADWLVNEEDHHWRLRRVLQRR